MVQAWTDTGVPGEIWVAAGTYVTAEALELAPNVHVYGGFRGDEFERNARELDGSVTILSGGVVGADRALLDGFVIVREESSETTDATMVNEDISITVRNCEFPRNSGEASAIRNERSSVVLERVRIVDNYARRGGGAVKSDESTLEIRDCVFERNRAVDYGGAVFSQGGVTRVFDSRFVDNHASGVAGTSGQGGAITVSSGRLVVSRSMFQLNNVSGEPGRGGGGAIHGGHDVLIGGSWFLGNESNDGGGAVEAIAVRIHDSVFWGNVGFRGGAVLINERTPTEPSVIGTSLFHQNRGERGHHVHHRGRDDESSMGLTIVNSILLPTFGATGPGVVTSMGGATTVMHSAVGGGCASLSGVECGDGNLSVGATFVNAPSWGFSAGAVGDESLSLIETASDWARASPLPWSELAAFQVQRDGIIRGRVGQSIPVTGPSFVDGRRYWVEAWTAEDPADLDADFSLVDDSPLIDAGSADHLPSDAWHAEMENATSVDLDGEPRVVGERVDIGPLEHAE